MDNVLKPALLLLMCWTISMEVSADLVLSNVPPAHLTITANNVVTATYLTITTNALTTALPPSTLTWKQIAALSAWMTVLCA